MTLGRKAFVIGLDGATWDLLLPWAEAGHLPTLARLLKTGAYGRLATTIPPVSASAWVSFATGANPGRHGVFDFVFPKPGTTEIGVSNVNSRGAPPFWETVEAAGGQVGLVNVPLTYPPQPHQGFTVCGFLAPNQASAYTYPAELKEEIRQSVGPFPLHEFEGNRSRHVGRFLEDMLRFERERLAAVVHLLRNKPWDLFVYVLKTTDTVQHEIWHLLDPQHPRHDPDAAAEFTPAILRYYQEVDGLVARLMAEAPPDTFVLLMSDHGGGPFHKFFHVNNWLVAQGWLHFRRTPWSLVKRLLFRVGVTPVNTLRVVNLLRLGRVRKSVKRGRGRGLLRRLFLSFDDVDWSRTKAFAVGNFGQIYLNVKGQRPQGTVTPGQEYERLRQQIIEAALALRDPETGEAVIRAAYRREEIYHGPRLALAPDIILHTDRAKYVSFGHADFGSNRLLEPSIGQTGHHQMDGIVLLHGPGVAPGELNGANIMDVAPTVLYALDLPIPAAMDGRPLTEAFKADYQAAHPIRQMEAPPGPVGESGDGRLPAAEVYSGEEREQMMEHLRDLGYVA
ncbi:MAG: alkaline phosphatase family protein [Chloroflexota bacterium]